jgi:uncharacterized protein DUF6152
MGTPMNTRLMIIVGVAVALSTGVPLRAHHSGLTLFSDTTSTLKGVVKNWVWSNPHCLLTVEVTGADGQAAQWVIELQAPNSIYPGGYRRTTFKPGDAVTLTVHPVKNGRPYGRIVSSVLADGRELGDGMLRMPATATP